VLSLIVRKDAKAIFRRSEWVERTPESDAERIGVIHALTKDVANMESGKTKSRRYTLSEFEEKFSD
jgi:hypothetical protein